MSYLTEFERAVQNDNLDLAQELLQDYAVPIGNHFYDQVYQQVKSVEMFNLMKKNHFLIKPNHDLFLHHVKCSNMALIRCLISHGFSFDNDLFIRFENVGIAQRCHLFGYDVTATYNTLSNLDHAIAENDFELVEFMMEHIEPDQKLWESVKSIQMAELLAEKLEVPTNLVRTLLNNDAPADLYEWALNHGATVPGKLLREFFDRRKLPDQETIDWFKKRGLLIPDNVLERVNRMENMPGIEFFQWLSDNGVQATDGDMDRFMERRNLPDIGVFRWLVNNGADVENMVGGKTRLARTINVTHAELLLRLGANPNARTDRYQTVIDAHIGPDHGPVIEFLLENDHFPKYNGTGEWSISTSPELAMMLIEHGTYIDVGTTSQSSAIKTMIQRAYPRIPRNNMIRQVQTMVSWAKMNPNKLTHWLSAVHPNQKEFLQLVLNMTSLNNKLVRHVLMMIRCY